MKNSLRAGPLALIAVLLLALIAAPALAQPPLAEVARKEAARRASISEKSRFYTNDDLAGGSRLTTGAARRPDPEAGPAAESGDPPPPAGTVVEETTGGPRDETYWRERITAAREARQRAELMAAALQNRIDGLLAEFTARDDPAQRAGLERDRRDALTELEATRTEIDRLTDEIAAIREEARRAGASPGWLR